MVFLKLFLNSLYISGLGDGIIAPLFQKLSHTVFSDTVLPDKMQNAQLDLHFR